MPSLTRGSIINEGLVMQNSQEEDILLAVAPLRKRIRSNKRIIVGGIIVLIFVFMGILAPFIGTDPNKINAYNILTPPNQEHPLGTDQLGRDLLARIIWGSQISLLIGILVTAASLTGGILVGTISGYFGGYVDNVLMRVVDILLAFPPILLAIAVVAALGPGLVNVMIAVAVWSIPSFSRLVRSVVLTVKELDYITAAKASGEKNFGIIIHYILPNCLSPIIVQATLRIATVILVSAALSFIGLGVQPPTPEWGVILSEGRSYIQVAPHLITFPGAAIAVVVIGFNLLGDGLRDVFDVRLSD